MACLNHSFIVVVILVMFGVGIISGASVSNATDEASDINIATDDYSNISEEITTAEITDSLPTLEPTEQLHTSPEYVTETEEPQVSSQQLGPYEFQVLNDDTGEVCIKAHLEAELIVHYISSKKTSLQQATIPVDPKANVDGSCSSQQAVLTLNWSKFILKTTFNMINDSLKCSNSKNGKCWMLTSIQFTYDSKSKYFNHAKDARVKMVQSSVNKEFFRTPDTMSQSCDKDVLLKLPSAKDKNKDEVDIKFMKLQIQPFSLVNETFGPRKECEEGNAGSQSVVSVAVGATLGVVILIVIIIYAVGRRIGAINDRTGYKSVD